MAWANHRWPFFADRQWEESNLAILPICGLQDWAPGYPLDVEEQVTSALLGEALEKLETKSRVLTLPPVRFVFRGSESQYFASDPETIHLLLEEILKSVGEGGFGKVVLLNSNPWNESFIDVVARDARIAFQLQMFCINLSGLGLSFNPEAGSAALMRIAEQALQGNPLDSEAVSKLHHLIKEILDRPPLADRGRLPQKGRRQA